MLSSLFRVDRPGSGEKEDILESKIALKINEGMLKTFETDCIVPGKKIDKKCFRRLRKEGKTIASRKKTTERAQTIICPLSVNA